jgi:DNA phosphorothioation-associated putative methyltransferase
MTNVTVTRHRTAIHRTELSRPIRVAINDRLITQQTQVFDYGCGYGDDIRQLQKRDIRCSGWDPTHRAESDRTDADIVNIGYVINVIENPSERKSALCEAWDLSRRLLIVSARLTAESRETEGTPYADGFITRLGTFQKFYEQHELRDWIENTLGVPSIPAAPGIFYIFRDQELHHSFIASRYRRKAAMPRQSRSDVLFERHRELLEPLMNFLAMRGRLPEEEELGTAILIRQELGSLKRACKIIQNATGVEKWDRIREERSQDLLIYLALARFGKRPPLSQLPRDLQLDAKSFFSTYKRACTQADDLLFSAGKTENIDDACRKSAVGKLTPTALYIHISALPELPPILRVYEGCARAYVGVVEGANIIKLYRREPQISYLSYPDFERDPHPALFASLVVPLRSFHIKYREYKDSVNPPILHRKEEFISPGNPLRGKFEKLTKQEIAKGLYDSTANIGTRNAWQELLAAKNLLVKGHRLVRRQ